MKEGIAIIEQTGESTKSVFIDQEVREFARLNKRTKNRIDNQKKEQAKKVRFRNHMEKTANRILAEGCIGGAVALAGTAGMIAPVIWIPTAIICLCAACLRLGAWFERAAKK